MHNRYLMLAFFVVALAVPCLVQAAPLKTCVLEFTVVGAANKDELKGTLQGLLSSRLVPQLVELVENPDKAELVISGSYVQFGAAFTIDLLLRDVRSGTMNKVYEEGEATQDVIPALGRLAGKANRELERLSCRPVGVSSVAPVGAQEVVATRTSPVAAGSNGYVVKTGALEGAGWSSEPLEGVFFSMALGRTIGGGREIYLASEHSVRIMRQGPDLKQVAEVSIPLPARVVAIDTGDLDRDGVPEVYVTVMDRETLSSRIYLPTDDGLHLLAENLPWFFRGVGPSWSTRALFGQKMDGNGDYVDSPFELVKEGNAFRPGRSLSLPRSANIFNFTRFSDSPGSEKTALLDADHHLVVVSADGKESWKSGDNFGGSETYFQHETGGPVRTLGGEIKWQFLEQRITPLSGGVLLVPRNEGTFSMGHNRSFNKYSMFALKWSGALLKEVWHTQQMPCYLADYGYDASTGELVLLEVVQKKGLFTAGKTIISINKVL